MSDRKKDDQCQDCTYYLKKSTSCRRYPPSVIEFIKRKETVWPTVSPSDGCGEFKKI